MAHADRFRTTEFANWQLFYQDILLESKEGKHFVLVFAPKLLAETMHVVQATPLVTSRVDEHLSNFVRPLAD